MIAAYTGFLFFFREIMNDTWRKSIIANYQRFSIALGCQVSSGE